MKKRPTGLILAGIAGGIAAAGGLYAWHRINQLSPNAPQDAKDAGQLVLQGGQKVLAVAAHPDDLEMFAGGTLRRLHLLGNPISVVIASSGEQSRPRHNLRETRKHEQQRAGSILGYEDIRFLDLPDRALSKKQELHDQIKEIWQREQPHLVFTYDHVHIHPWIKHPDHVTIGEAVIHSANELDSDAMVMLYGSSKPTVAIDIGPVMKQKIWAVTKHKSQFPAMPRQASHMLVQRLARVTAKGTGYRFAEAFRSLHNVHTFVPPRAEKPMPKHVTFHKQYE